MNVIFLDVNIVNPVTSKYLFHRAYVLAFSAMYTRQLITLNIEAFSIYPTSENANE